MAHVKEHADIPITWDYRSYSKSATIWKEFAAFRDNLVGSTGSGSGSGLNGSNNSVNNGWRAGYSNCGVLCRAVHWLYTISTCVLVYVSLIHILNMESNWTSRNICSLLYTSSLPTATDVIRCGGRELLYIPSYTGICLLSTIVFHRNFYKHGILIAWLLVLWDRHPIHTLVATASTPEMGLSFLRLWEALWECNKVLLVDIISSNGQLLFYNIGFYLITVWIVPRIVHVILYRYSRSVRVCMVGCLLLFVYGTIQVLVELFPVSRSYINTLTVEMDMLIAPYVVYQISELKSIFVKFAQYVGARRDVISPVWVKYLSVLHDQCPPSDTGYIRHTIQSRFHHPVHELYHTFNPVPVASASIAQVHEATIIDPYSGEITNVVVKVQHERVAEIMKKDLYYCKLILQAAIKLNSKWKVSV